MKTLTDYYNSLRKDYKFKIKIALCDMTDAHKDAIDECLKKYDLKDISGLTKTPVQASPLDFPNIPNTSVVIFDVTMAYPATPNMLQTELAKASGISEGNILVFTLNDPRLVDQEEFEKRRSAEFKDKYETKLGSAFDFEDEPEYGDALVTSIMGGVTKTIKDRKDNTVTNTLVPKQKVDDAVGGDEKSKINTKSVFNSNMGTAADVAKKSRTK